MALIENSVIRVLAGIGKRVFQADSTSTFAEAVVLIDPATGNPYSGASGAVAGPSVSTITRVAASATSVTLKAANSPRRSLVIFNEVGSATLKVALSSIAASATNYTVEIPGGGPPLFIDGDKYAGAVTGIWASATGAAQVTET